MNTVDRALDRAERLLAAFSADTQCVQKAIWSSPAGKTRMSSFLASLLPPHTTYVEPFCGSAAVYFAKEPADVEVLNDADTETAKAFRTVQRLTPNKLARLRSMDWVGNRAAFERIKADRPRGELQKLHRFLYLASFAFGRNRNGSFDPSRPGRRARAAEKVAEHQQRLKGAKISGSDYEAVCRRFDSPNTAFYFDPPYAGYDIGVGERNFDEARFIGLLSSLKGKWLLTYGMRGDLAKLLRRAGYRTQVIDPSRYTGSPGRKGGRQMKQLIVTNYALPRGALSAVVVKRATDQHSVQLLKADSPDEHYVLGVVLEPDTTDAQGDIYSAEEVRTAAHRFLADAPAVWLMHQSPLGRGSVRILESYIAPQDIEFSGGLVRKGTWLLALRILDDDLWTAIKRGELTGLSIRGSAITTPATDLRELAA